MPAERTTMRQVREVLRLKFRWWRTDPLDRPPDRRGPVDGAYGNQTFPGCRAELAVAGGADRRHARSEVVPRCRHEAGTPASGRARLGEHPSRAQAQARHAVDPVGRVHRARSGGLSLLALLRAVPHLGRQALGHDAPEPRGRRQAVRRLRRRHGAGGHRPADRRGAPGANLRRGDGRLELQLCRGDLDADARRWIGAHTAHLQRSAACRVSSFPTTPRSPSSRPACTSRRSTERMPRWRRTTAPPCCRPGRAGRATRPRSKLAC